MELTAGKVSKWERTEGPQAAMHSLGFSVESMTSEATSRPKGEGGCVWGVGCLLCSPRLKLRISLQC